MQGGIAECRRRRADKKGKGRDLTTKGTKVENALPIAALKSSFSASPRLCGAVSFNRISTQGAHKIHISR
jgi:hypothetical protein